MKKMHKTTIKIIACLALLMGCLSCQKDAKTYTDRGNRLISVQTGEKTGNSYYIFVNLGHSANGCPGCILFYGSWIHVDCQGRGDSCRTAAAVTLNQVNNDITATTTDTFGLTNQDFFNMPARSLNYTDESNNRIYLNIPAQLIYRDEETQQFTFTGLSFSDRPMYTND
jgi:hypothetical protein